MDQNQGSHINQDTPSAPNVVPTPEPRSAAQNGTQNNSLFIMIQKATAWVMIGSAVLFAMIGILAVWEVFGPDGGDVVMKAFSSLAIIAFAALVVNVSARLIEEHRN